MSREKIELGREVLSHDERNVNLQPFSRMSPTEWMTRLSDLLRLLVHTPDALRNADREGRFADFTFAPDLSTARGHRLCTNVLAAYENRRIPLSAEVLRDFYDLVIHRDHRLPHITTYHGKPASWFYPDATTPGYWLTVQGTLIDADDAVASYLLRGTAAQHGAGGVIGVVPHHALLSTASMREYAALVRLARTLGPDNELTVVAIRRWIAQLEDRNGRIKTDPLLTAFVSPSSQL